MVWKRTGDATLQKSLTRPQKKKISGPCRDWHFPCATEFVRSRWALTPFPGAWPQQTGLLEGWLAGDLRAAETADRRRRGNVWTRACPQGAAGRLPAAKPGLGVGRRYRAQPAHCSLRRLLPQARCVPPSHPPSHVIIVPMPHCLCLTPNKQPSCPVQCTRRVQAAGQSALSTRVCPRPVTMMPSTATPPAETGLASPPCILTRGFPNREAS